jgi:anti-sigma regulatory factor (Ser/Thr protein kinase)/plasmid maintenance system antidote protein VapI
MTKQLEFKISSGLKNLIGKELIVTDNIAIFELVKNAYDAYAKNVKIAFLNIIPENLPKGPKILIIDDGNGMSYDDIINKWLFVGYSDKKIFENDKNHSQKKDFRDKIQEKRVFAGAKGIGRFSSDRLGKKLTMFTKRENENHIHLISLEWDKFEEDQEKKFQEIKADYSEIDKIDIEGFPIESFEKGTILEISNLNDSWDRSKILKLKRYMQRLINPSSIDEDPEILISLIAPEFENEDLDGDNLDFNVVNGPVKNIVFEKLGIKTTEINCIIDENGEKLITRLTDRGTYIFEFKEKNTFQLLKGIKVKLFYLNEDAKTTFTKTMGIRPIRYGSVFLYKNRFRIHPLGDEGSDWLELDKEKTQSYGRHLSSRELMGRAEIIGVQPIYKEVTNREGGLIKNEHVLELVNFIKKVPLRRLERYVVEALEWESEPKKPDDLKQDILKLIEEITGKVKDDPNKEIDFNPDLLDIYQSKQVEKVPRLLENLEKLSDFIPDKNNRDVVKREIKSLKTAHKISEAKKTAVEKELAVTQKTSLFLEKAVGTEKEILINLNHSIKITTFVVERIIKEINEKIKTNSNISDIIPLIDEINLENQKIRVLSSYVSLANFDTKLEVINRDLVLFIKEYMEKISPRGKVSIQTSDSQIEFIRKFKPLEVSIVFDNLFDNARKAEASRVMIKFQLIDKKLHVFLSDNGKGVDDNVQKYIFNRGISLTDGSGIGLYHVKKILGLMEGEIKFVGNNVLGFEKGACFEVVFK